MLLGSARRCRQVGAFGALLCLCVLRVAARGDGPPVPAAGATLLFFNDAHQLSPVADRYGDRGGVARLATLVRAVRREQPATLVLFGGDLAGGTLFGGQFKGEPQVEAFNRLGIDLAAFGQHDFDFGTEHTRALVRASRFPWITTNLDEPAGGAFAGLPRSRVVTLGGLRIALLGLTDAMDSTTEDGGVRARPLVAAAVEEVARLARDAGALDAIVAMAQTDTPGAEALLRAIPALDAVLAEEQAEDRSVMVWLGRRPILAPAGNLGSAVRLDLTRPAAASGKAELILDARALPVDGSLDGDADLLAFSADYDRRLDAALAEPVAALAQELPADGARERESALGSLVADAFRAQCASEVGLVTGGSLRADLPAGQVRRREVAAVLPFGNRVACVRLSGALLRAALEHGVAGMAAGRGTLLQVSGLRYRADAASAGPRALDVEVAGAPLDDARRYTVALSSYILAGGDGFAFGSASPAAQLLDVEALAAYLRSAPAPVGRPAPGRLTRAPQTQP